MNYQLVIPTLDTVAVFTWSFGSQFLLETLDSNYIWSDPDYGGDNTIKPYCGYYYDWIRRCGIDFGRDKGKHAIGDYCGKDVKFSSEVIEK